MSYETRLRRLEDRHLPQDSIGKEILVCFVGSSREAQKILKLRIGGGTEEWFEREDGESEHEFYHRVSDKPLLSASASS